ncbi:putative sorting nexin-18-like [Scophthalmus maximus]|uniref:Sorting nexin n=1 Tax=Scophthalmus maximus TaxID=52904 RepID=A0A2U9CEW5_SCOMX|nr:sorting nexin-18 [Scophthalmus maximus]AWP15047.1 putative sorting nexin-18-like [Scophthalmus maximus]
MALKARVLYDFSSENPGEISITESELVTLFSEEELDGWLEGENSRGEAGLFPASYVEVIRDHITSNTNNNGFSPCKTKALPPTQTSFTSSDSQSQRGGSGGGSFHTSQGSDDDWDDDWDDPSSPATSAAPQGLGSSPPLYPVTTSLPARRSGSQQHQHQQQQAKSSATVGRNLNRFSTFVKSGGEAFLLGEASAFVKDGDRICVVMGKHGPEWQEDPYPFTCTIDDPTKQTKFKGMKSYMSYGLTPTHTNIQVNRRYKHFDWLYARLVERFPVISVPRLPEKQATGRFEEDFISKRRKGLIWWMNHMTSHPVLARCDVFQHFLTCGADEKAWKMGKRKAERDDLVGANFFLTISPPAVPLDLQEVESKVEGFKSFTKRMDENTVVVNATINEFARKQITGFKKEYQKVGQSFKLLAQAFELDQQAYSVGLNRAISYTGETYEAIGEYFAEQPRQDLDPISDLLDLYRGHLDNFPDIVHVQKGALTKVKDCPKQDGDLHDRCNIISCATLAEIQHFHRTRVRDFRSQMQHHLRQQIGFFQKITAKLEDALQRYDDDE